jgi:hypothetical protein
MIFTGREFSGWMADRPISSCDMERPQAAIVPTGLSAHPKNVYSRGETWQPLTKK